MKPEEEVVLCKAGKLGIFDEDAVPSGDMVLNFFEWAYQEGKKEAVENTRKRPTKMELATT